MVAEVTGGRLRSGDDVLEAGADLYYDLDERCLAFNHSCEPNAMLARERDLVALRAIAPGEDHFTTSCPLIMFMAQA